MSNIICKKLFGGEALRNYFPLQTVLSHLIYFSVLKRKYIWIHHGVTFDCRRVAFLRPVQILSFLPRSSSYT